MALVAQANDIMLTSAVFNYLRSKHPVPPQSFANNSLSRSDYIEPFILNTRFYCSFDVFSRWLSIKRESTNVDSLFGLQLHANGYEGKNSIG